MTALRAEAVEKHFGGVHALRDVSLDLKPGEIHGLIGPNGSGKTTLLNLLSGYYQVNSGRILVGDRDITRARVQDRVGFAVARTFQKPRLLAALSVLDNAMLGGWNTARSSFLENLFALPRARRDEASIRARAQEVLAGVGLGGIMKRRAGLLSHAEQRFLEIARGLLARPQFILLDEPAGGLTEQEIDALGTIITTLRDCGIGVLIVEHHTDFVFRLCDRVTTLNLGTVLKRGTAEEVRHDEEVIRVYLGA